MAKRGFQGAMMRTMQVRDHLAMVVSKELIAPHFLRVHLHSDTLFDDAELVPTAWLRGWFPDHTGKNLEHQRGYTISGGDAESGDFSLDFVLHEPAGPASAWAQRCEPGDALSVNTLGSSKFELPEERPAGYLLIGDSAAMPGLAGIVAALPHEVPIELYLEQHSPEDRLIPFPEHPRMRTHWVPRTGPDSLADAVEARDWSDWHAWATPESASLKRLRTRLRDEFGFPKSEMHVQAYWIEGRAMGKLRDDESGRGSASTASPAPSEASDDAGQLAAEAAIIATPAAKTRDETAPAGAPAAESEPAVASATASSPASASAEPKGEWRAAAGRRLLAPLKPVFMLAGALQALVTLVELAPFFLLVELSRRLLAGAGPDSLWPLGIWAVALIGLGALLGSGLLLWLHAVDARFERELRHRLLGKLARLPLGWFGARGSSQVKQTVQDDTLALHYLVTHAVPDAVAAVVAPVAVLVYLFAVDWRLALLMFVPVLAYAVTMYLMILRSYDTTPKALKWAERMAGEADAYLEGQPVVRVFGGAAASTFRARLGEYIAFLDDWQRPFTGLKTFMDLVTRPATFLLLICVFGTLWISSGGMEPIDLLPFLLLGTTFGSRLLGIGYGLSGLRDGLLAARRVQLVLEERELVGGSERQGGSRPERRSEGRRSEGRGRVEFDGVSFGYRQGQTVLDGISLELAPGTVTALVGPSGSGKSTLAALLARFHDIGAGAIRIDGDDLRDLSAEELYARVGFVFQDTQLVRGTVRENIALAAPDATMERIEAAARAAHIHDRILRLPNGYDDELGPDAALSGGERQRLTIARAILADTPVLVLDEATAFADPESEFLVQQALGRLTEGRTVLVIAHRLHTVTGVDRIVVLDGGRIAEAGAHEELLERDGRYAQLWRASRPVGNQAGADSRLADGTEIAR